MAMNTKGGRRREKRRAKRAAKKVNNLSIGGSKAKEEQYLREAHTNAEDSRGFADQSREDSREELKLSRKLQKQATNDYDGDRGSLQSRDREARTAINGIQGATDGASSTLADAQLGAAGTRSNALATGSLVGSTENILAQRAATLGASPTIGQATETALAANRVNANTQLQNAQQAMNRQSMGLASGMGESGAGAMQAAIMANAAARGQAGAQTNMQLADQNAQLRYSAAQAQREQDLAEAGYASDARLGAAGSEREAALGFADKTAADQMATGSSRAELVYGSAVAQQQARAQAAQAAQATVNQAAQREQALLGQRSGIAAQNAQTNVAREGLDKDFEATLLTGQLQAGAAKNATQERSTWKKVLSPSGVMGSNI